MPPRRKSTKALYGKRATRRPSTPASQLNNDVDTEDDIFLSPSRAKAGNRSREMEKKASLSNPRSTSGMQVEVVIDLPRKAPLSARSLPSPSKPALLASSLASPVRTPASKRLLSLSRMSSSDGDAMEDVVVVAREGPTSYSQEKNSRLRKANGKAQDTHQALAIPRPSGHTPYVDIISHRNSLNSSPSIPSPTRPSAKSEADPSSSSAITFPAEPANVNTLKRPASPTLLGSPPSKKRVHIPTVTVHTSVSDISPTKKREPTRSIIAPANNSKAGPSTASSTTPTKPLVPVPSMVSSAHKAETIPSVSVPSRTPLRKTTPSQVSGVNKLEMTSTDFPPSPTAPRELRRATHTSPSIPITHRTPRSRALFPFANAPPPGPSTQRKSPSPQRDTETTKQKSASLSCKPEPAGLMAPTTEHDSDAPTNVILQRSTGTTVNREASAEARATTPGPTSPPSTVTNAHIPPETPSSRPPGLSTPSSAPRDLSSLFQSLPGSPGSISKSPSKDTGLARSMLKRSQITPRKGMTASVAPAGSPPDTAILQRQLSTTQAQPQPESLGLGRTTSQTSLAAKRTYGKSRSFLVEIGPSQSTSQSQPESQASLHQGIGQETDIDIDMDGDMTFNAEAIVDMDLADTRESYAERAARWGLDEDAEGLSDPTDLRSIAFQRSKGENRRFSDAIKDDVDGLKPEHALPVRRASAVEIVKKMLDPDFVRWLKAQDAIGKSWDTLRTAGAGDGDRVLDSVLAFFLAIVTHEKRNIEPLIARMEDVVATAARMLEIPLEEDPLAAGAKLVKGQKLMIEIVKDLIFRSELAIGERQISTRRLTSTSLATFAALRPTPLTLPILSSTCTAILREARRVTSRLAGYSMGLPLFPDDEDEPVDLKHLENCLRVLECFTLRGNSDEEASCAMDVVRTNIEDLSRELVAMCVACHVLSLGQHERIAYISTECLISGLRILVNLSGAEVRWCHALLSHDTTLPAILRVILHSKRGSLDSLTEDVKQRSDVLKFDLLCLALALLTNLVACNEAPLDGVRTLLYDPACRGARVCTLTCKCPLRISSLQCLVDLYITQTAEAKDSFERTYVSGHAAFILGILASHDAASQTMIFDMLPGSSRRQRIEGLVDAVREFGAYYSKAAEEIQKLGTAASDPVEDEEADGQPVVDTVAQDLQREKTEGIATQIVAVLEALRTALPS